MWRVYLEQGDFVNARKITSQMRDKSAHNTVIRKEVDKFITEKKYTPYYWIIYSYQKYSYVAAAELLAHSNEHFEVSVLTFLRGGSVSRNGLKRFLELKLGMLDDSKEVDS